MAAGRFGGTAYFGTTFLSVTGSYDAFMMHVSSAGTIDWAIKAGGTSEDEAYGIAYDGHDGAMITGRFQGTCYFDSSAASRLVSHGSYDSFAARVLMRDLLPPPPPSQFTQPRLMWSVTAGGSSTDLGWAITTGGNDDTFVVGEFRSTAVFFDAYLLSSRGDSDAYVFKLDSAGQAQWATRMGGTEHDSASGVAAGNLGWALVAGYFGGTAWFGDQITLMTSGSYDGYVTGVDAQGVVQWAVKMGGSGDDRATAITSDGAGGAFVTGYFSGTGYFGSHTLEQRQQRRLHRTRDQHGHHHMGREGWRRIR